MQGLPARVIRYPFDNSVPDAHTIITQLQNLTQQYGVMPEVRLFAESILTGDKNNDQLSWIKQLTQYVSDHVIWTPDPEGQEYFISPITMLADLKQGKKVRGDCDDHVLLLNSLLNSIGLVTRAVGVKLRKSNYFNHVISSVFYKNNWMDIDPCAKNGVPQPVYTDKLVV